LSDFKHINCFVGHNNLSFVLIKTTDYYPTKTTVLFIPFLGGQFQPVSGGQFEMAEGGQFHLAGGGQFAWVFHRDRTEEIRYSRRVSMDEIEKNEFNLNISRYVSTSLDEEIIDLHVVHITAMWTHRSCDGDPPAE